MVDRMELSVRVAGPADADLVAQLLHDFNSEYNEPTPGPARLAERMRRLLAIGDMTILLGGAGPDGIAVLRFRAAIWSDAPECYLAELYVVPQLRGQGLGRALMETAIEVARARGADHMDLGTSDDDVAARSLYESLGFINREGGPDGPITYFYERDI
jgi:ribosomal protein S18 acetylase RimI-like enzyme